MTLKNNIQTQILRFQDFKTTFANLCLSTSLEIKLKISCFAKYKVTIK